MCMKFSAQRMVGRVGGHGRERGFWNSRARAAESEDIVSKADLKCIVSYLQTHGLRAGGRGSEIWIRSFPRCGLLCACCISDGVLGIGRARRGLSLSVLDGRGLGGLPGCIASTECRYSLEWNVQH